MKRSIMKNRQIWRKLSACLVGQDGAIATLMVLLLPVLIGFAGLAVDIGHMYVVKAQLKNAADAGALAGAGGLIPYTATKQPDWTNGTLKAKDTVGVNYADNHPLSVSEASAGSEVPPLSGGPLISQATPCYWNLNSNTTKPANATPLTGDVPAMHVKVSKTAGQNDGPIKMFLASVLRVLPADASATSLAMVSFPSGMKAGGLKPMVATKAIVDKYWGRSGNFQFKIGDGTAASDDTMWSSFQVADNSDAYTKQLIEQGNPTPLYIGNSIHLQPGVRAVDYGPNEMGMFQGQTVVLPIVDPVTLVADTEAPVLGFIAFHITGYSQGGQYVEGYFDKDYVITNPQGASSPNPDTPSTSNPPQLVY